MKTNKEEVKTPIKHKLEYHSKLARMHSPKVGKLTRTRDGQLYLRLGNGQLVKVKKEDVS